MQTIRCAVVTVSDKGYAGEREDVSGPVLARLLQNMGAEVAEQVVVPDEQAQIEQVLVRLCDQVQMDVIITTGGTGLTPRDVTPEATQAVIERPVPGLPEALRADGARHTPLAALSRGVAGIRGRTLIINLPGSPKAVREGMAVLEAILPHTVRMLRGEDTEHTPEVRHA